MMTGLVSVSFRKRMRDSNFPNQVSLQPSVRVLRPTAVSTLMLPIGSAYCVTVYVCATVSRLAGQR